MSKNILLKVQGIAINITQINHEDFICLTDMAKYKDNDSRAADIIKNWIRNRSTIEFLGTWESIHNQNFKVVEFDHFRKEAGLPSFVMSVSNWIEKTNAIGIFSKLGKYGGTYAHKDIALEFGSAISPSFKLYLIKEFQNLKERENIANNADWNVKRLISKVNYRLHTAAVQQFIIPVKHIEKDKEWIIYASEADLINVALFGFTAKQWKDANPTLAAQGFNIRDVSDANKLVVIANIESINAEMIKSGMPSEYRFKRMREIAKEQIHALRNIDVEKALKNISDGNQQGKIEKTAKPTSIRPPLDELSKRQQCETAKQASIKA